MKTKLALVSAIACIGVSTWSTDSKAYVVAGWDFSQYLSAGLLSIDGETFATTLGANYSNLDPTFNLGPDSAVFGTLYYDGQFGSTAITPDGTGLEQAVPSAGSLTSNLEAPVQGFGDNPFDSLVLLIDQGQQFANQLGMVIQINGPTQLVFRADLTSVPETGDGWSISFAGKTLSSSSSVGVEFSTDGASYASVGSANLTTNDARFAANLSSESSEVAYVRLSFAPATGTEFPIIDNVAISVPEPGILGGSLAALLVLIGLRGARSRSAA